MDATDDDGLEVEDLLSGGYKPKSKVDGKKKGNRTELGLCKLLTTHFGVDFTRSVGSGNRWGQVNLSEQAKQVFSGDICVPENFLWVFESKGGYEKEIDLTNAMDGEGIAQFDKFIEQSSHDAELCGRKPIICWKRNRKPWLACIRSEEFASLSGKADFPYRLHYREWVIISLTELLEKTERSFWFKV